MKKILFISLLAFLARLGNAQDSIENDSLFIKTRDKFLLGIKQKYLPALDETVDDSITMIFPDGEIMYTKEKFLDFNEAWFKKKWEIISEVISTTVESNIAYALVRYHYYRVNPDGTDKPVSNIYQLLIFKKRKNKWTLLHNQHTRIYNKL